MTQNWAHATANRRGSLSAVSVHTKCSAGVSCHKTPCPCICTVLYFRNSMHQHLSTLPQTSVLTAAAMQTPATTLQPRYFTTQGTLTAGLPAAQQQAAPMQGSSSRVLWRFLQPPGTSMALWHQVPLSPKQGHGLLLSHKQQGSYMVRRPCS